MHTFPSAQRIRSVSWSRLPLGCIILQWPQMAGAQIPELLDYPVITERLRQHLGRTYHFLQRRSVVIADPDSGLEPQDIRTALRDTLQLQSALRGARSFQEELRGTLLSQPDAREGLREQTRFDGSPYSITRSIARSTTQILRDTEPFGNGIWPTDSAPQSVTERTIAMLKGEAPALAASALTIDIGVDVSRSMIMDERGPFAYNQATAVLRRLAGLFPTLRWRLWAISDAAVCIAGGGKDAKSGIGIPESLDAALQSHSIRPGETHFAPYLRAVLNAAPPKGRHVSLLVTDGECSDRQETLRCAERLRSSGTGYLQLVLHRDNDHRTYVLSRSGVRPTDNIRGVNELEAGEELVTRSDEETRREAERELQKITDIAEAARGEQLVITWFPLFSLVTLDVYQQAFTLVMQ